MKVLVVNPYWYPWNTAGTFRWLNFSEYIDFDVLTSIRPNKGFKDETIKNTNKRCYRFGYKLPACISGLLLAFVSCFIRADAYVFSSPPETLLFGAWFNEKILKRKVLVDMRDSINRDSQRLKLLIPVYRFFYDRLENVVVCWQFLDPSKEVVYHGYDEIERSKGAHKKAVYDYYKAPQNIYRMFLSYGLISDFSHKPKGYGSSSFPTIRKLGYDVNQKLHDECYTFELVSWKESALKMKKIIDRLGRKQHG